MTPTAVVADAPERDRFEVTVAGELAGELAYRRMPGGVAFVHTEIDPAHEGEGLGTVLVRAALDAVRAEGLALHPFCPFVRGYIERHPEYLGLVPAGDREPFGLPGGE
jgi:predicted GNAT family acetyltransferase